MKTEFKNGNVYHVADSGVDIHHPEDEWCGLCDHIGNESHNSIDELYDDWVYNWGGDNTKSGLPDWMNFARQNGVDPNEAKQVWDDALLMDISSPFGDITDDQIKNLGSQMSDPELNSRYSNWGNEAEHKHEYDIEGNCKTCGYSMDQIRDGDDKYWDEHPDEYAKARESKISHKSHNIPSYIDKAMDDYKKGTNSPNEDYEKKNYGESIAREFGEFELPDDDIMYGSEQPDDFYLISDAQLSDARYNMSYDELRRHYVDTMKEALERQAGGSHANYYTQLLDGWSTNTAMFDVPHSIGQTPTAQQAFRSAKEEVSAWWQEKLVEDKHTYQTPTWESRAREVDSDISKIVSNRDYELYDALGYFGIDPSGAIGNYPDSRLEKIVQKYREANESVAKEFNVGRTMICPKCNKEIDAGNDDDFYSNGNFYDRGSVPLAYKMEQHFEQEHTPEEFGVDRYDFGINGWIGNNEYDAFHDAFPEYSQNDATLVNSPSFDPSYYDSDGNRKWLYDKENMLIKDKRQSINESRMKANEERTPEEVWSDNDPFVRDRVLGHGDITYEDYGIMSFDGTPSIKQPWGHWQDDFDSFYQSSASRWQDQHDSAQDAMLHTEWKDLPQRIKDGITRGVYDQGYHVEWEDLTEEQKELYRKYKGESRIKAIENVDIGYEKIQPYPTKANEAEEDDYITVDNYDGIYDEKNIRDSGEEVDELVRSRKMNGYGTESIMNELMIKYGASQDEAWEKVGSVEVSVNDKFAFTFFGKSYKECNEAEIQELKLYAGDVN